MSRTWPIALIVVAVVVIGVFVADTLGIIRVPSLLSSGVQEEEQPEEEVEALEDLDLEEPQPARRRPPKKKPPAAPKPAEAKAPTPAPKPSTKDSRLTMPTPTSITTSRLPGDINRDAIHTAILRQGPAFQRCLKDAVAEGDDLPNRVLVSMTASPYGKITENHINDRAVERSFLGRCVLRKSGSIRLPMFSGDPITIAFPLAVVKN